MWSKRRDQETAPAIQPNPSAPAPAAELSRRDTTMSSPTRTIDLETSTARGGQAVLGKNVTVKGQIFSREDLTIDGEVEGTVECQEHRLTIGPNARVQAGMKAREIVIQGNIQGNIEAVDKVDIKKEAKLVGDIKTARITIEDGAYFKGSIDISKVAPPARTAAGPPPPSPATVTAPTPMVSYNAGTIK
jgi:cytoskeletal protein CcmA (bactofilin family)